MSSNLITASIIMTQNPISVKLDTRLEEITEIFTNFKVSSLPVVNESNIPLGALSELGLVKILIRSRNKSDSVLSDYIDVLTPLQTIPETAGLENMVKTILKNPCHRAYVFGGAEGGLIGVVSPKDVITVLTGKSKTNPDDLKIKYDKLLIELQEMESKLEHQRKLISDSPLMMHSVDRKGVIQMANRALHNSLGYEDGELIGKTLFDLYPHSMHKAVQEGLNVVLQTGFHDLVETAMVCKDQTLIKVEVISSSISDKNGIRTGTITISRLSDRDKIKQILNSVVGNWDH
jgi:PAS domain S-box-containing protein